VFTQNDLDMSFLAQIKNGINLNFGDNNTAEKLNKFINNNVLKIEEDYVNKHPIMNSMIIILTHMNELFFANQKINNNRRKSGHSKLSKIYKRINIHI